MALLNNFVVEKAAFDGFDIGILHVAREIPGFLAFLVIYLLLFLHEQVLAILAALVVLGVFTALTANFPSFWGLMVTTILSSVGFHYFETVNQSLQLQWLDKKRAPQVIGWLVSAGIFRVAAGIRSDHSGVEGDGTVLHRRLLGCWRILCGALAHCRLVHVPALSGPGGTQHKKIILRQPLLAVLCFGLYRRGAAADLYHLCTLS